MVQDLLGALDLDLILNAVKSGLTATCDSLLHTAQWLDQLDQSRGTASAAVGDSGVQVQVTDTPSWLLVAEAHVAKELQPRSVRRSCEAQSFFPP